MMEIPESRGLGTPLGLMVPLRKGLKQSSLDKISYLLYCQYLLAIIGLGLVIIGLMFPLPAGLTPGLNTGLAMGRTLIGLGLTPGLMVTLMGGLTPPLTRPGPLTPPLITPRMMPRPRTIPPLI